jgi:hypothetical protein
VEQTKGLVMKYRYVPQLKSKLGEAVALSHLATAAKDRMLPVVNLTGKVGSSFTTKLVQAWKGRTLGLDGRYNFEKRSTPQDMNQIAVDLTTQGVTVVPCAVHAGPAGYNPAVSALVQTLGTGVIVKVNLDLAAGVDAWVLQNGWAPKDVDLIVQVRDLSEYGTLNDLKAGVLANLAQLASAGAWRSITLSGAAAPKDMGRLSSGSNRVKRKDWALWQAVHAAAPVQLDFGDWCSVHPSLEEPPGASMAKATVSVRYTLDDVWLILKGKQTSGSSGAPMPAQYASHAKNLMSDPGFGGLVHCWADDRIRMIAASAAKSGNRGSWVEISVNRHLCLVADRLP